MTIKEQMRNDSGMLDEMARKELLLVVKKLKGGDIKGAAEDYVDAGGSTSSSGVSRTVNAYITKEFPEEPLKANLGKFKTAITNLASEKGIESKRATTYTKKEITGKTKEGEVVTAPKGQGQRSQGRRSDEKLAKEQIKHKQQMDDLVSGDVNKQQAIAFDILKTWGKKKRGAEDKDYDVLKKFAEDGENKAEAVKIIGDILEQGKEAMIAIRGVSLLKSAGKLPAKNEGVSFRERMLMESYAYTGYMFWENYILSNIVRTVNEDLNEFDEDEIIDLYTQVYGEQIKPILEYMVENQEELNEAAQVKGTLLFEEAGAINVKNYLMEALPSVARLKMGGLMNRGAVTSQTTRDAFSRSIGSRLGVDKAAGGTGFLGGLWGKLKEIGKAAFDKITPFLQKGLAWAKGIVQKGATWFAATPIAQVVVPAVLIAGSLIGAKKLVNKIRAKRNQKKMSAEEEEKFGEVYKKKETEIDKYKKAA